MILRGLGWDFGCGIRVVYHCLYSRLPLGVGSSAFELERAFKLGVLLEWFCGCREFLVLVWGFM